MTTDPLNPTDPAKTAAASRNQRRFGDERYGAPIEDLSDGEQIALDVMRFIFVSFAAPQTHAWTHALSLSEAAYGPVTGPVVASANVNFVQAMRRLRKTPFCFSDPRCPECRRHLSDPEFRLIKLARLMAGDLISPARVEAMVLCEGGVSDALLLAGHKVGRLFKAPRIDSPIN